MAGRLHLALVPAHAFRPALALSWTRVALALAGAATLLGLLYLAARETPLFAVRTVQVTGGPPAVRAAVREAAASWEGSSLVALDGDELRRRLEALPTVRSFRYDRSFPHTLAITVVPERPAAIVHRRSEAWLVSARGRVMQALEPRAASPDLPRVRLSEGSPDAGALLEDAGARLAVRAATQVPADFPARVRAIRVADERLAFLLGTGTEIRLGDEAALPLKLAVAARVLRSLPREERGALAYLDVSLPERPVASDESQVSSRG